MKSLIAKIKGMVNAETISYLVFGVLTTAVNIGTFSLMRALGLELFISNVIAWIVGVLFAFITNKLFVFRSKSMALPLLLRELVSFTLARLFSLGVELLGLHVFVKVLDYNETIVKIALNVLVIIINYVLSKLVIFRRKPDQSIGETGDARND